MFWIDDWEFCRKWICRERKLAIVIEDQFAPRQWLQGLQGDATKMLALRRLLFEESGPADLSRTSDELVIERITELLVSGRLHLHGPTIPTLSGGGGQSQDSNNEKLVPFPLSERKPRAPVASARGALDEPPTFSSDISPVAQAAVLTAAAADGKPFCPE